MLQNQVSNFSSRSWKSRAQDITSAHEEEHQVPCAISVATFSATLSPQQVTRRPENRQSSWNTAKGRPARPLCNFIIKSSSIPVPLPSSSSSQRAPLFGTVASASHVSPSPNPRCLDDDRRQAGGRSWAELHHRPEGHAERLAPARSDPKVAWIAEEWGEWWGKPTKEDGRR